MMGLDRDRLVELVQVVVRNPLRAFLSALGVGWGLFMIIITVGAARAKTLAFLKADFFWTLSPLLSEVTARAWRRRRPCRRART